MYVLKTNHHSWTNQNSTSRNYCHIQFLLLLNFLDLLSLYYHFGVGH